MLMLATGDVCCTNCQNVVDSFGAGFLKYLSVLRALYNDIRVVIEDVKGGQRSVKMW